MVKVVKKSSKSATKSQPKAEIYENIIKNISKLEICEKDKDVTFVFEGSDSGEKVKAHKLMLTAVSSVFEAMFSGNFAEKDEVKISDIKSTTFQLMIK